MIKVQLCCVTIYLLLFSSSTSSIFWVKIWFRFCFSYASVFFFSPFIIIFRWWLPSPSHIMRISNFTSWMCFSLILPFSSSPSGPSYPANNPRLSRIIKIHESILNSHKFYQMFVFWLNGWFCVTLRLEGRHFLHFFPVIFLSFNGW